jgi:hypothetical protein
LCHIRGTLSLYTSLQWNRLSAAAEHELELAFLQIRVVHQKLGCEKLCLCRIASFFHVATLARSSTCIVNDSSLCGRRVTALDEGLAPTLANTRFCRRSADIGFATPRSKSLYPSSLLRFFAKCVYAFGYSHADSGCRNPEAASISFHSSIATCSFRDSSTKLWHSRA